MNSVTFFYQLNQQTIYGCLPKSSELAVVWYSVSMANGNTAIEGLYNGAAFVFNEEQLKEIQAKATTCLSSQYKNCE
jgi:hypothetical protein